MRRLLARCLPIVLIAACSNTHSPATTTTFSATWPIAMHEAESAQLGGAATVVGAADASDRAVGDLGGEASGRRAVTLMGAGDSVSFAAQTADVGANAAVVRFSIPDAPGGGGASSTLTLIVNDSGGHARYQATLNLTSRYAWLYGGVLDGIKLYDVPANAKMYGTAMSPTHLYDEIQLQMGVALQSGNVVVLQKAASDSLPITIDFIELETIPLPFAQPNKFLSLTDAKCGAIALDLHKTGNVFDGVDDSSYAGTFNAVNGTNPITPTNVDVNEKVFYTNRAGDTLMDTSPTASSANMSMFALADHNLASLQACANAVASSNGAYAGVYVPPGRFYIRGAFAVPSNLTIQGAGVWYSKFVAVDTAPPMPATVGGMTGIQGATGNLIFTSQMNGSDNVKLSGFSLFGNVTQRANVDNVAPFSVHGQFTNSTFDSIWVEHYEIGLNMNGASNMVQFSNLRVRNTFADGIDFYGSTSHSTMTASQARSTGDDGFALWSQGASTDAVSQGMILIPSTFSVATPMTSAPNI